MENWERQLKEHNLRKALSVETEFDQPIEVVKARSGIYKPTVENLKQGRAGERYGKLVQGGTVHDLDEDHIERAIANIKKYEKEDYKTLQTSYSRGIASKIDLRILSAMKEQLNKLAKGEGGEKSVLTFTGILEKTGGTWVQAKDERGGKYSAEIKKEDRKKLREEGTLAKTDEEKNALMFKYFPHYSKEASKEKAIESILKAFDVGLLSKDVFEKAGKRAQIGEVRSWGGVQMKKVSSTGNAKQDWQPVKGAGKQKAGEEPKGEPGKGQPAKGEEKPPAEEELKEHATQSSEQALANAIKQSPDPTVRQVAHTELQRRQQEEKPTSEKDKDQFPSKEFKEESPKTRSDPHFKEAFDSYAPKKKEPEKKVEPKIPKGISEDAKKALDQYFKTIEGKNISSDIVEAATNAILKVFKNKEEKKEKNYTENLSKDLKTAEMQIRELGARARKAYDNSTGEKKAEAKKALDQFVVKLEELKKEMSKTSVDSKTDKKEPEKKVEEDPFEKKLKELEDKRSKELGDHFKKLDELYDKYKEVLTKTSDKSGADKHRKVIDDTHKEGDKMIARHREEIEVFHEKHGRLPISEKNKKVEKSIQGIRYF